MIILNNKKFASNEEEFINSLFEKEGTCVGYYKKNKSSITLQDHNKQKIGVINKHGVLCAASLLESGKWWYSFMTIKLIGEYKSYMQSVEEPTALIKNLANI